ncbi:hypothetical protein CH305_20720 [Rhodococcus sp. 15-649-2-2]|uniref:hypothetical protein n=1 Tax=Rhodococcus sp. 15-649-2-2 TaxID=2023140 RepID=UPI000B9BDB74|nr:hypothetical protein [Rhodococcus sp. 15-649-2-2]OZE76203.1 hypothetical protein CH305_20720 [Rhodococcus sp. 15-649-2-2]
MIVLRLFGVEMLAVGRPESDDTEPDAFDNTAGSFELADPELAERDHDVYLASRRRRPAIVAIGSRHNSGTRDRSRVFGFGPSM